eukprot:CAMPEP_0198146612 /NCGR_PEP_ID=MMETSP1443-20131203/30288_1 /TAXON_ID=186043 /ORGANISM="Entomoneis sp., Strain CCMP2396" /LENGTH=54 /DNA_ID=CAMNT_0043810633 /DNA_START=446 /DNA_END=610 /DNA_ORIENTATION=+
MALKNDPGEGGKNLAKPKNTKNMLLTSLKPKKKKPYQTMYWQCKAEKPTDAASI